VTVDSHAADMPAADLRHLLDRLQPRDSALRGHIVRFSAKPLAYTPRADVRVEQRPQLTAQHEQFRQDLAAIRTRLTGAPQAQRKVLDVSYRHEYWFVLNGVAVTLSDGELQAIRRLPYVDQVSPDVAVHALLDQSVRQIGADRVQTEFGIKGSGVVVAVIDTGVDYLLPQLGGGLGAGFRVIGGYDFVNH
jgi:subtilisin family serine protease